jgi:transposase
MQDAPIPKELWDQIPPAAQAALRVFIDSLHQRIAILEKQVADLTARLGQNSSNSSKPPSSDGPQVKRQPPRPPSGRSRGAQPGHQFQRRPFLPANTTLPVKPSACGACGHELHGDDPKPYRHQVIELPVLKPDVTEYQLHSLKCLHCGTTTRAEVPAGVPLGHQGPRLEALTVLLSGAYRLGKRPISTLLADVFGIPLCMGMVCKIERQTAKALEPVVAKLRAHVRRHPINMDETGWRENRQRAWLWVAVTSAVTVFHIARSRGSAVARHLLGPGFHWVLTSDRFSAYQFVALGRRQICWAHLRRDFQAMIDRGGDSRRIGEHLLKQSDAMFAAWYCIRDGTNTHRTFQDKIRFIRNWVRHWLELGRDGVCAKTAAVCTELLRLEPALWTFTQTRGVEPTNNAAERALRHAVLWRKTSHGTDSAGGSLYVANVLSVVATCRQQGRNVLDFLHACCHARLNHTPAPTLLPRSKPPRLMAT